MKTKDLKVATQYVFESYTESQGFLYQEGDWVSFTFTKYGLILTDVSNQNEGYMNYIVTDSGNESTCTTAAVTAVIRLKRMWTMPL